MIKQIFSIIFLIFSIFGFIFISTLVHEYSHYLDYKEIESYNKGAICLYGFETDQQSSLKTIMNIKGHHHFFYSLEDREEVYKINEYTEKKAYSLSIFILIIYLISFYYVIKYKIMGER